MSKNRALNWWKPAICGVSMLLFATALAHAEVYRASDSAGNLIRLLDEPCPVAIGWLKLKKADFTYQGKKYDACWAIAGDTILILDSAGDVSGVPLRIFRREEGV